VAVGILSSWETASYASFLSHIADKCGWLDHGPLLFIVRPLLLRLLRLRLRLLRRLLLPPPRHPHPHFFD
jgi:hypothetical protein